MALYPCDVCHRRYVGAGNHAYVGWATGSFSERKRRRLCPVHVDEYRAAADRSMRLVSRGEQAFELSDDGDTSCWQCHLEPHTVMSFLHLYSRDSEPEVYVMHTCPKCNSHLSLDGLQAVS